MKTIIKQINKNTFKVKRLRNELYNYKSDFPCIYCTSEYYEKQIKKALRSLDIVYHHELDFLGRKTNRIYVEASVMSLPVDCLDYFYIVKCYDWDIDLRYSNIM